jgi:hypothetical protein
VPELDDVIARSVGLLETAFQLHWFNDKLIKKPFDAPSAGALKVAGERVAAQANSEA